MDDSDKSRTPPRLGMRAGELKKEQETKGEFAAAARKTLSKNPENDNQNGATVKRPPRTSMQFTPRGMRSAGGRAGGPKKPPSEQELRQARIDALHKKMRAEKNLPLPDKPRSLLKDVANKELKGVRSNNSNGNNNNRGGR